MEISPTNLSTLPAYTEQYLQQAGNSTEMIKRAIDDLLIFLNNILEIRQFYEAIVSKEESLESLEDLKLLTDIRNDAYLFFETFEKVCNALIPGQLDQPMLKEIDQQFTAMKYDLEAKTSLLTDVLLKKERSTSQSHEETAMAESTLASTPTALKSETEFELPKDFLSLDLEKIFKTKEIIVNHFRLVKMEKAIFLAWLYKLNTAVVHLFPLPISGILHWENVVGFRGRYGITEIMWEKLKIPRPYGKTEWTTFFHGWRNDLWSLFQKGILFYHFLPELRQPGRSRGYPKNSILIQPGFYSQLRQFAQDNPEYKSLQVFTREEYISHLDILKTLWKDHKSEEKQREYVFKGKESEEEDTGD